MRRRGRVVGGLLVGGLGVLAAFGVVRILGVAEPEPAAVPVVSSKAEGALLYCEFYNFVGRTPKVGFTFRRGTGDGGPVFAQADRIETDGTRIVFGDEAPAPVWSYEAVEDPAVLTSPDGAIRINLYAYDPARRGMVWFEAGLRSIQYLNLEGKCRQSGV